MGRCHGGLRRLGKVEEGPGMQCRWLWAFPSIVPWQRACARWPNAAPRPALPAPWSYGVCAPATWPAVVGIVLSALAPAADASRKLRVSAFVAASERRSEQIRALAERRPHQWRSLLDQVLELFGCVDEKIHGTR